MFCNPNPFFNLIEWKQLAHAPVYYLFFEIFVIEILMVERLFLFLT